MSTINRTTTNNTISVYNFLKILNLNISLFIFIFFFLILNQSNYLFVETISCDKARMNCALRNGCGFSLRNYMMECTDLIAGRTERCNGRCEHALIGLISSDEGKDLINCDCNDNDYCKLSKKRIEVCKKSVFDAVAKDTIVSCSVARWICISDQLCRTALEYYKLYCRKLFQGKLCSSRCNNSLSILDRQEKAIKLRTCYCDGTENFPCHRVKYFTEKMCFSRHSSQQIGHDHNHGHDEDEDDDNYDDDDNDEDDQNTNRQEENNSIDPFSRNDQHQHQQHQQHYHHQNLPTNQYHYQLSSRTRSKNRFRFNHHNNNKINNNNNNSGSNSRIVNNSINLLLIMIMSMMFLLL